MATRTVTGTIKRPNGTGWDGASVRFRLTDDTYTLSPDETFPIVDQEAVTDASGQFSTVLSADLGVPYEVTLPDRETFEIAVPAGSATTLEALRAAYNGGVLPPAETIETIVDALIADEIAAATATMISEAEIGVIVNAGDSAATIQGKVSGAAGKRVLFEKATYDFATPLSVPADTILDLNGATLRRAAGSLSFCVVQAEGVGDFTVIGPGTIDGNRPNAGAGDDTDFQGPGRHNLYLGDAQHVTIDRVRFTNMLGDAVYMSHDVVAPAATPPYTGSRYVAITRSRFIGSGQNRNGVSLINGRGITIDHCFFYRIGTDAGGAVGLLPGPIDIEPNVPTDDFLHDIVVTNNIIIDDRGSIGALSAINVSGETIRNLLIAGNIIAGSWQRFLRLSTGTTDPAINVNVKGNQCRSFGGAQTIDGFDIVRMNVTLEGNQVYSISGSGVTQDGGTVNARGNRFAECATYGYEQVSTTGVAYLDDNYFHDCGTDANPLHGAALLRGNLNDFTNNRVFSSGVAKTQTGLYVPEGTRNWIDGNRFRGVNVASLDFDVAPQYLGQNILTRGAEGSVAGTYPPAADTHARGQIIHRFNPSEGDSLGWVCVAGGTPGTWVEFGRILSSPFFATALTIAGDAITLPAIPKGTTKITVTVDTEGGAATDNLDTINITGSLPVGMVLVLTPANSTHDVVIVHSTTKILTTTGANKTLGLARNRIWLEYAGGTIWNEITANLT